MGWLKKFGQIVLKVTEVVTGVGPILSAFIPGKKDDAIIQIVSKDLAQVAAIVAQVEIFGQALGLPGADKLTASAPAVAQIIMQSAILANHKIADPVKFKAGCTQVASGMADILSSLEDKVDTQGKTT